MIASEAKDPELGALNHLLGPVGRGTTMGVVEDGMMTVEEARHETIGVVEVTRIAGGIGRVRDHSMGRLLLMTMGGVKLKQTEIRCREKR